MAFNQISVMKVEGIERFSWTDKKTGEVKNGGNLHCSYNDESVQGVGVARVFVTADTLRKDNLANGAKIQALDRGREGFIYVGKL